MIRILIVLAVALATLNARTAAAGELVYVEWKDCASCIQFNRQMAWAYASSKIGKRIPLRRVNILRQWPADLNRVNRPAYTPVFILVDKGREVGRFNGYASPQQFTRNLRRLLPRLH